MKTYPESRLTDLLIEFDKMGFCPTTVCPNPEQTAIEWKEQVVKEIQKLQAENTELRARLENHDLPVNVWDTVYCIRDCGTVGHRIDELKVIEIVFEYNNQMRIKTCYGLFGYEKWTFGLDCFADPAKAEARLKELQEEEE